MSNYDWLIVQLFLITWLLRLVQVTKLCPFLLSLIYRMACYCGRGLWLLNYTVGGPCSSPHKGHATLFCSSRNAKPCLSFASVLISQYTDLLELFGSAEKTKNIMKAYMNSWTGQHADCTIVHSFVLNFVMFISQYLNGWLSTIIIEMKEVPYTIHEMITKTNGNNIMTVWLRAKKTCVPAMVNYGIKHTSTWRGGQAIQDLCTGPCWKIK